MFRKVVSKLFLAALLAVLLAPGLAQATDKKIDIYVESGKLKFDNSECPSDQNDKGCIKTDKGDKNKLKWEFMGADGSNWNLTTLTLLRGNLSDADWACAVHDFDLDSQTGVSGGFTQKSWGGEVRNENDCDNAYEVHYELEAIPSGGGDSINSDPVIRNGGGQR